jgi:hypothetical protein
MTDSEENRDIEKVRAEIARLEERQAQLERISVILNRGSNGQPQS